MVFKLYPEALPWWTFEDYQSMLDAMARFKPRTVLEFGPGSSTLAMIEGGAGHIDTLEDNPEYYARTHERLALRFPDRVTVHRYRHNDPVSVDACDSKRYDLGFVDGPRNTMERPASFAYALARCAVVLCHDVATMERITPLQFDRVGTLGLVKR